MTAAYRSYYMSFVVECLLLFGLTLQTRYYVLSIITARRSPAGHSASPLRHLIFTNLEVRIFGHNSFSSLETIQGYFLSLI